MDGAVQGLNKRNAKTNMSRFITDGKMYLVQLCKYKHK